jgi:hypothetical protein
MWRNLKKKVHVVERGSPGERFKAYYRSRLKSEGKQAVSSRILNLALAAGCFVLGVVFSFMPVLPGFVFFFACALLLAAESLRAARFLDFAELKIRKLWRRVRGRRRTSSENRPARRVPRPAK